MSRGIYVFVCAGIGEDDLRTCTWWHGRKPSLPDIRERDNLHTVTMIDGLGGRELRAEGVQISNKGRSLSTINMHLPLRLQRRRYLITPNLQLISGL